MLTYIGYQTQTCAQVGGGGRQRLIQYTYNCYGLLLLIIIIILSRTYQSKLIVRIQEHKKKEKRINYVQN